MPKIAIILRWVFITCSSLSAWSFMFVPLYHVQVLQWSML
jgi:hypothetical protein